MTTELKRFDAYEIHGVARFGEGNDRFCETVPDDEAHFWSLYGHIPGEGVQCIGDFRSREAAENILFRITGRTDGKLTLDRQKQKGVRP